MIVTMEGYLPVIPTKPPPSDNIRTSDYVNKDRQNMKQQDGILQLQQRILNKMTLGIHCACVIDLTCKWKKAA